MRRGLSASLRAPAKQSILSWRGEMDCFAPLAMTAVRHASAFSRHDLPEVLHFVGPHEEEGAGKTGCALHPRSHVRVCNKNLHMSIQEQRRTSGLPCAMALRLIRDRPGDRLCLSPQKRHQQRGARPSRFHRTQQQLSSSLPPRPPLPGPYDQTIMMRPSCGPGCANLSH